MEVKDKIMYHYHSMGIHDEIWVPQNEFIVDDSFEFHYCTILKVFSTAVLCGDENEARTFSNVLNYYLENDNLEKCEIEFIKKLLLESRRIIKNTNIYKREMALENYRKDFCPHLPSRLNSIWVADECQLDFWENALRREHCLFKLSLTGNLFKSSDEFIPDDHLNAIECYQASERYWNPIFDTQEQEKSAEFLFQGKVKILEQVPITK